MSRKTNTTRSEVLGCATLGATQLLLHDTPGVVCPESWRGAQHASRVASAWRVAATADVLLFVVDAARQAETADPRVPLLFRRARAELAAASERRVRGDRGLSLIDVGREGEEGGGADENSAPLPPSLLVLNKVDRIPSLLRLGSLRGLLDTLGECHPFQSAFGTAALLRRGVGPLAQALLSYARPGPWPLPPTRLTDRGPTAQALAATTGALFDRLHEELPYEVRVKHTSWEDFRDGSVRIEQALLVPNENVRAMVIGKHGAAVGQIGIQARRVLERTFGRRVHLILKVKVSRGRDTVDVDEGYHAEVVQFSALARARAVQRLEQASLAKAAAEA